MNSKHKKTLNNIFKTPTLKNIVFSDIESLLLASGAVLIEGSGSRVAFVKDGMRVDFHRPHPAKESKPYQVKAARAFLRLIGVHP